MARVGTRKRSRKNRKNSSAEGCRGARVRSGSHTEYRPGGSQCDFRGPQIARFAATRTALTPPGGNQIVVAEKPPSTTIFWPVTNDDAFCDASQTTAPANSLGSPKRAMGVCPMIWPPRSV